MDKGRNDRRFIELFIAELESLIPALERDVLALEKARQPEARQELFKSLMRSAHTLKGSANAVKVEVIGNACHRLEDLFTAARDGRIEAGPDFFDGVLPMVDALADVSRRMKAGEALDGAPIHEALRRLADPSSRPAGPAAPRPVPVAAQALPKAAVLPAADMSQVAAKAEPERAPASGAAPNLQAATIKIAAAKLDELLAHSGELLTTSHRFDDRYEDAATLYESAAEARKAWRLADSKLSALLKGTTAKGDGKDHVQAGDAGAELAGSITRHREAVLQLERRLQGFVADLDQDRRALHRITAPLDAEIRRARMLPLAEACEGLSRMVRDLTADRNKRAELTTEGGEIEIDRSILEGLREVLLHLVRNAIDHGIEPPEIRHMAGKPDIGRVAIVARLRGPRLEVTVSDDGAGLDLDAIRTRVRERGWPVADDERELIQNVFRPGFSTAREVTQLSGRGVGLDIAMARTNAMRGTIEVTSEPGKGARFVLDLPLTLTTVRSVLVEIGGQVFAVETANVQRVVRIPLDTIKSVEGRDAIEVEGRPIPLVGLAEQLGVAGAQRPASGAPIQAVVVRVEERAAAFAVDGLMAERELVVANLGPRLRRMPYVVGGALLSDGRIAVILNAAELVATMPRTSGLTAATRARAEAADARKRLIVADDSLTVRTLVKSILEAAGYEVTLAADGGDAWRLLQEKGADLIVSDVDMPRMSGFELTEVVRGSSRHRALPIILVTGQETEEDKARGMAVGADAYLLKSAFDQGELLSVVEQLL